MIQRALIAYDWISLCVEKLKYLQALSASYDELICVVENADELSHCGLLLVHLKQLLLSCLNKPFYLLPIARRGVAPLSYWLRWRILIPPFVKAYIDSPSSQSCMTAAWKVPVEIYPGKN